MNVDQMKEFLDFINSNDDLKAKLKEIEGDTEAITELAKKNGFDISASTPAKGDALDIGYDGSEWKELSDEELESMAGGTRPRSVCAGTFTLGCRPPGRPGTCQEEAHDEPWGRCPGMRPMRKWLFGRISK